MHFPLTCSSKLRKDRKTKLKIFQQVKLGREAKMQQQVVDGRGIASSSQGERLAVLTDQEEVCLEYVLCNDPQDQLQPIMLDIGKIDRTYSKGKSY